MDRALISIISDGLFYEMLNGSGREFNERSYLQISNYIRNTVNLIESPTAEDVEVVARGYWHTYFDCD